MLNGSRRRLLVNDFTKRIAFLLLLYFYASFAGLSQVCKISDSNDTVEVFSYAVKDNTIVEVTVSNDSQSNSANVTVVIQAKYKFGSSEQKETYEGKGLAKANSSSVIAIPVRPNWNNNINYRLVSVEVLDIKGTKCL